MATKPTKRLGFHFMRSYFDVLNEIPDREDKLDFLLAIINKQFLDENPENLNFIAKLSYESQRHSIEKSVKGWKTAKNTTLKGDPLGSGKGDPKGSTPLPPKEVQVQVQEEEEVQEQVKEEVKVQEEKKHVKNSINVLQLQEKFKTENSWKESVCRNIKQIKQNFNMQDVENWLETFFKLITSDGEEEKTVAETKKHFNRWLLIEIKKENGNRNSNIKKSGSELKKSASIAVDKMFSGQQQY